MGLSDQRADIAFLTALLRHGNLEKIEIPVTEELGNTEGHWFARSIADLDLKRKQADFEEIDGRAPPSTSPEDRSMTCDILVVCPLAKEQEMTCLAFDQDPNAPSGQVEGTKEYRFSHPVPHRETQLEIVISCLNRQTNLNAGPRTAFLLKRHDPKFAILTGIGATFPKKAPLGHVVGGFLTHYTEGGVRTEAGKLPRPIPFEVDDRYETLLEGFDNVTDRNSWKEQMLAKSMELRKLIDYQVPTKAEMGKAKIGFSMKAIMSGEELLKHGGAEADAQEIDQRIKSAEMEAAGFAAACKGRVPWLVFRGHCDHADPDKDDKWQRIAALNSALCVRSFLETEFLLPAELTF